MEEIPCVLPKKVEEGIFYDLQRLTAIDKEICDSESTYRLINGKNYYRLYSENGFKISINTICNYTDFLCQILRNSGR